MLTATVKKHNHATVSYYIHMWYAYIYILFVVAGSLSAKLQTATPRDRFYMLKSYKKGILMKDQGPPHGLCRFPSMD